MNGLATQSLDGGEWRWGVKISQTQIGWQEG